jgi:hypothetical protein
MLVNSTLIRPQHTHSWNAGSVGEGDVKNNEGDGSKEMHICEFGPSPGLIPGVVIELMCWSIISLS